MSTRSRYNFVRHVQAGVFEIIAKDQRYFASSICGWTKNEVQNKFNPEVTDYSISIHTKTSIFSVPCKDIDEWTQIMNELSLQIA